MTSVSSSPNGANKPNKPWFCTNERLRWEFFSKGQKRTIHSRANEINKLQETQRPEDLTIARNKKPIKTMKTRRRITRKQKNRNTKTEEESETNTIKMQIDNDGQYVELENIQLEEDHIMEGESLEPEPSLHDSPEDVMDSPGLEETSRILKDDNNSEEELQHPEENNEVVKSEDDNDIDEGGGTVTRKFTRSTRRPRVIITPKKQQTRKSQRKSTRGSTKSWESEYEFKGRDIVFVDPLDDKAEFWWPAMIVPNDEIDESMDVDGKLEENLFAGKYLVRYFEDMTYSVVEYKVRRAMTCKTKGEPNKAFKWDYWKRPLWESQESAPVTTTTSSTKRTRSTSKGGSKSEKNKPSVRRNSSSTKSRSSINSGNHSSQEGVPSEEEDTVNNCIASPPTLDRRRKSETENIDSQDSHNSHNSQDFQDSQNSQDFQDSQNSPDLQNSQDFQDSQSNSGPTKDNIEMEIVEIVEINKSPKRRHSSLTDKSDEGEESSNLRSRKIKRVSAGESMDEEPTVPSPSSPNTESSKVETLTENPMEIREIVIETSTENNNERTKIETLMKENYEQTIIETLMEKNDDLTIIETLTEKNNEPIIIETSTEDNNEPIIIETSAESNNEPSIEMMEEDNVPASTPLTSPPLTVEELSESAQTNISSFKFDDPTLDAETKEKMYDEAEEKLRSLMKEWRAINRNLRKIEKDLMSKKARKSRNNEELGDVDIETDDEGDVEPVDSSDIENNHEDGEEREDEEEIQVITRSKKINEESKVVLKSKHILKKI
ncbi:unnamed protein product [Rhizophagus irregularis]|uniref:PWWP domain-containing protein n=6 Tax=Rhizophagus irregularis TaxID=588596 RepID=A0A915YZI9_9GLOM|nr:unnamed protein product [Rhizophagus irregularis]CAB5206734.1 unnamed protein product [Rhizophagus irregularis]CAB5353913.1 unnamed protein product [Rhizophagus irregularis]